MNCSKCSGKAVFKNPTLCKEHFISYFEGRVEETLKRFKMLEDDENVIVGVSGGKDSLTVLYLLKKFHGKVDALLVDEGIEGYRDSTIVDAEKFCEEHDINLKVVSYKEAFGKRLDEIMKKGSYACAVCGTFRRYLLNKYAKGYDKVATGHNLDDEAQVVLMNFFKSNTGLFLRVGPVSPPNVEGFVPRIKPLYLVTEKEVTAYSLLKGFQVKYNECPYAPEGFRTEIRELLNDYEAKNPGAKKNVIESFLKMRDSIGLPDQTSMNFCSKCGEPTDSEVCRACVVKERINGLPVV